MILKKHNTIRFILKIYLLVLSIFSLFRLMLFFSQRNNANLETTNISTIIKAFIMGIRFDIVISGYILILPTLVFLILELFQKKIRIITVFFFYWIFIFFSIAFLIAAADIPYFIQFNDRFNIGAFEWINNLDFVFAMIMQEPKYFMMLIPFLVVVYLFFKVLKKIFILEKKNEFKQQVIFYKAIVSLVFLGFIFLGIRGRIEQKSPIRVGTAYFSNNAFLNKLGLNPVFTLMRSYLDSQKSENKTVQLMDSATAINNVQNYLSIQNTKYQSPIARERYYTDSLKKKPNIVLIIMESMSAAKMKRFGNTHNLTPFLDSLATKSLFFTNCYSAGKHTFNGIFSTLFSFPALYRQHTMTQIRNYDGMAETLKKYDYSTSYFTTHDGQFDNIAGFLKANSFDKVISQKDYPSEEVKTTLGVPDDYMFRYAIPVLNKLGKQDAPFFTAFMTTSDHGPFYIPPYFHPKNTAKIYGITEYADWSLKQFMLQAKKQDWYDNTLFVFIADHGAAMDVTYDLPMNYFHVPCIIYAPKLKIEAREYTTIASQIDVFPTIMGLINKSFVNNTLGLDLLHTKRPFAIVNNDEKIGIVDTDFLCILAKDDEDIKLYNYKNKDKKNYTDEKQNRVREMKTYGESMLQVTQDLILTKKTSIFDN